MHSLLLPPPRFSKETIAYCTAPSRADAPRVGRVTTCSCVCRRASQRASATNGRGEGPRSGAGTLQRGDGP